MKTSTVLLYGLGAFAVYELFLKPKPPVYPTGYTPTAANPISSLLNLITGKPSTTTMPALAQGVATGAAQYSTSQAAGGPVTNYYTDAQGNVYNTSGQLVAAAPAVSTASSSGGGGDMDIDPTTGISYDTEEWDGD